MQDQWAIIIPCAGTMLAVVMLVVALRAAKKQRLVDDLPTSKTTGVFIGLVELKGTAEVQTPLRSYLAGGACVWYSWNVQEHWSRTVTETYTDSDGKTQTRTRTESGWTTVAQGGEQIPFYLRDDCGVILVRPEGATIEPVTVFDETCGQFEALYYAKGPAGAVANSDHRRRFVEKAVPLHAMLYVVGQARERSDIVAPEITEDKDAPMFLISTRSEEQVSRGLGLTFWLTAIFGLVLVVAGFVWGDARHGFYPQSPNALKYVAIGFAYLFSWALGWIWMAYNSLVNLRQRVRQAWSNVDVQLKRRNDLIPNLVNAVKGLRDYERNLQTELAALRAQLTATPPGVAGPDHDGCVPLLMAVSERYPEVKADGSFLNLQKNLTETEQRIALARGYFNDIATFYNTRLQVVPDRFIAAMGGMQPQTLMTASGFERAPVTVDFAS
jgi:hypothetical protein